MRVAVSKIATVIKWAWRRYWRRKGFERSIIPIPESRRRAILIIVVVVVTGVEGSEVLWGSIVIASKAITKHWPV
jgi:hypothetical protein